MGAKVKLGRRVPSDWKHVEKHPLSAPAAAALPPSPVVFGIPWYHGFDSPEKIGSRWFIGRGDWGSIRGGHAICARPKGIVDPVRFWEFYDQGNEGACVGFGCSRAMSLENRHRYNGFWLYEQAQLIDEYDDTPPEEGTSVRAGMEILRTKGPAPYRADHQPWTRPPDPAQGISAYKWCTTTDAVLLALGLQDQNAVPLLNSWGRYSYPHIVYLPIEGVDRLLHEDGEAAVIVDRP